MAESCGLLALFNRFISTELQIIILTEDSRGAMQNMTCWEMASSVCSTLQELCCMPLRRSLCRLLRLFAMDAISCIMLLIVWSFVSITTYPVSSSFSSAPRRLQTWKFFDRLDTKSVLAISSSTSIFAQMCSWMSQNPNNNTTHHFCMCYSTQHHFVANTRHCQEQHKKASFCQQTPAIWQILKARLTRS